MECPKVQIHKKTLRAFKLRAWKTYPNEHIEGMFGFAGPNGFDISYFAPVDVVFRSVSEVYYDHDPESIEDIERQTGTKFLGYIHTHIGKRTCQHPSLVDYEDALSHQEQLMGVCLLYKAGRKYSTLHFEIPQPPFVLEISNK